MTYDDVKQIIHTHDGTVQLLRNWGGAYNVARDRVNGEDSYICPLCGHGSGASGNPREDGLTFNPRSVHPEYALRCFRCDFAGDVIDLYAKEYGLDVNTGEGMRAALKTLGGWLGYEVDDDRFYRRTTAAEDFAEVTPLSDDPASAPAAQPELPLADFTEYYKVCQLRLGCDASAQAYLAGRGISMKTAVAYGLGFDDKASPATAPGGVLAPGRRMYPCPRIITPSSSSHYVARSIDPSTERGFRVLNPLRESPIGKAPVQIFNEEALWDGSTAVFVVEGHMDALSILEVGMSAVALHSTSQQSLLVSLLRERKPTGHIMIALDNDSAGATANQEIKAQLDAEHIPCTVVDVSCGCKDPNEALVKDRNSFIKELQRAVMLVAKPDNVPQYLSEGFFSDLDRYGDPIPTGFADVDKMLGGGLYAGLYCVAAISSLGKTTFCLQMADQIAAGGHDVMIFSLEMSRLELVSKSLARTITPDPERYTRETAKDITSSLAIRQGRVNREKVRDAMRMYASQVGDRVSIVEGDFSCDVGTIRAKAEDYTRLNHRSPVIVVDYLQILRPSNADKRQTTKETIDDAVRELKIMSRALNTAVIVISSVNRANYQTQTDFESIKESGSIEYGCDVVFGLQLAALNCTEFDKKENVNKKRKIISREKKLWPRILELKALKNRSGVPGASCYFRFYPAADMLKPMPPEAFDLWLSVWDEVYKRYAGTDYSDENLDSLAQEVEDKITGRSTRAVIGRKNR